MERHMEQARMLAAQCWCDAETSGKEVDATLAEGVARRIAAWMETAAQMARNAEFYRGLLDECAKSLGETAYTADDGTVSGDPVRLNIPGLVARQSEEITKLRDQLRMSKAEALQLIKLLSALESWSFAEGKRCPDWLYDDLESCMKILEREVLK